MEECFFCRVSSEKVRLFDAVHFAEGVIAVCEKCANNENLPLLKKPTTFQLKEAERPQRIYEKLSKQAGIDVKEHVNRRKRDEQEAERKKAREELTKEEIGLKEIIDRNLQMKKQEETRPRLDLIDNFHWIIMRARRKKKLTISQLAEEIKESEIVLKMAEEGMLPEDDFRLVNKLENFLGIRIRKEGVKLDVEQEIEEKKLPARILNFKPESLKNLTIADLKEMKKRGEQAQEEIVEKPEQSGEKEEEEQAL